MLSYEVCRVRSRLLQCGGKLKMRMGDTQPLATSTDGNIGRADGLYKTKVCVYDFSVVVSAQLGLPVRLCWCYSIGRGVRCAWEDPRCKGQWSCAQNKGDCRRSSSTDLRDQFFGNACPSLVESLACRFPPFAIADHCLPCRLKVSRDGREGCGPSSSMQTG